jgi:hypothetical protein
VDGDLERVRVHLVHHRSDAEFAGTIARAMAAGGFERVEGAQGADLALLLVSRAALEEGLGTAPKKALEAGIPVLPLLVGDDTVPLRFPVPRKHIPIAHDVAAVLKHLTEHRKTLSAKQSDSKQERLGQGLLLALLHRA